MSRIARISTRATGHETGGRAGTESVLLDVALDAACELAGVPGHRSKESGTPSTSASVSAHGRSTPDPMHDSANQSSFFRCCGADAPCLLFCFCSLKSPCAVKRGSDGDRSEATPGCSPEGVEL